MFAVVKPGDGPGLAVRDLPAFEVAAGVVRVEVAVAAICGSDLPIRSWDDEWVAATVRPGQVIGHEFCGRVTGVGRGVDPWWVGRRVVSEGHLACDRCWACAAGLQHVCAETQLVGFEYPGCFAESIDLPVRALRDATELPVSDEVAALIDPIGNAVHACEQVQLSGARVGIVGGGPVGLLVYMVARTRELREVMISETSATRRALAVEVPQASMLAPRVVAPGEFSGFGDRFDVVFETSGTEAGLDAALSTVRRAGTIVVLGLPKSRIKVDIANAVVGKALTLKGVVGRNFGSTWPAVYELLGRPASGLAAGAAALITHRFRLTEYEAAFDVAARGVGGKVLLIPDRVLDGPGAKE